MRSKELVICGLKAVRSRFETNSDSVKRLFFNREIAAELGDICHWMAQERLVYRCVETDELERISGSVHHGGVVVVVEPPQLRSPSLTEVREWAHRGETLLVLDRISNVHNLGAIIRSAAFFGVTKLILPDHPEAAFPTEATYRVAEGGLDHVEVFYVERLVPFLHAIRSDYSIVGAASHGGAPDLISSSTRPIAIVMGNEEQGLSREVAAACERLVTIPGSNRVESLNVSAAAAVLLWESTRATRLRQSQSAKFSPAGTRSNPPRPRNPQ